MNDAIGIRGHVSWQLHNEDGTLAVEGQNKNLITAYGARVYASRGSGEASPQNAPTGMKLGTGSTAPAKTGAGAALATYLTNSHQGFDATYPSLAAQGTGWRITYRVTFGPGKATSTVPVTEVVIVNDTLADATSAVGATLSRVLLSGIPVKTAGQTLTITWTHDIVGA